MTRLTLLTFATAACGSSSGPHVDVDAYPTATHAPYPQVPDQGGPRLAHPALVSVTFANDARAPMLEAFASWIATSGWLTAVGAEYGVGPGTAAGVAHRPETPPAAITSGDVEAYLAAGITDGSIPRPANLGDALYIVYYPSSTTITTTFVNGIIKTSCVDYEAYHGEAHQSGLDFAYAVIPACGNETMAITQSAMSHELIEAATDAWPITSPAYQLRPDPTDAWFSTFQFEVEVGDLCEAPSRSVVDSGYTLQRSWSNAAAAAGGDPCVPGGAEPAFGTSGPATVQVIPAGGSADVSLAGWSSGTVADWQLVFDPWFSDGTTFTRARATLGAPTANNGNAPSVHITLPAAAPSGNHTVFLLVSSHSLTDGQMWPLVIQVQ
jgi:hypothetical protein